MKGFKSNIEKDALKNENFRKVLYSSKHLQVVLMSLKPGEEIGMETHPATDQFFRASFSILFLNPFMIIFIRFNKKN